MTDNLQAARETFSGKMMTETQLRQAHAIAGILHEEIHRSGTFREPLTDYAHAFARNKKFDAMRAETMIRDTYQARFGQTMNQTRESLKASEENLRKDAREIALKAAEGIGAIIRDGATKPFFLAYDQESSLLAETLGTTQTFAKNLMKEAFQQAHGRDLYEAGKEIEEAYHKPAREAEIAARKAEQLQSRSQSRAMS